MRRPRAWIVCATALAVCASRGLAQSESTSRLDGVSDYVERYFGRAQSLVAEETVTLEHLRSDLTADGLTRRLQYEIHLEWSPDGVEPRASVVRRLLRIGSRPPREGAEPECLDPKSISPEPLAFLLKERRERFSFREVGPAQVAGRQAVLLDYQPAGRAESTITGTRDCIQIDMPGRTRGRVWVDPDTHAVLRLDESLVAVTDVRVPRELQKGGWGLHVIVERADTSIRYQPVRFSQPDETLLLPTRVESVSVLRSSGVQRLRVTQTYRNYRRFLTETRVIP